MRLKDLTADIKNQRQKNDAESKEGLTDQTGRMTDNSLEEDDLGLLSSNQEKLDEM